MVLKMRKPHPSHVGATGHYNQVYGQVGAIIVLMLWLYVTGLMVLIGAEMNAVLVRMAEEQKATTSLFSKGESQSVLRALKI
jgi:uncharacterized BrkB/YihY/UPF0761 family membrane protein